MYLYIYTNKILICLHWYTRRNTKNISNSIFRKGSMFHTVNESSVHIQRPPKQRGSIFYITPAENEQLYSSSEGMPATPSVVSNWKFLDHRVTVRTTHNMWQFVLSKQRGSCDGSRETSYCDNNMNVAMIQERAWPRGLAGVYLHDCVRILRCTRAGAHVHACVRFVGVILA